MGGGWLQAEFEDYGLPWEPTPLRLRRLGESVEVMRSLWVNDTTDYDGEFYRLSHARCDRTPVQTSQCIWIGAGRAEGAAHRRRHELDELAIFAEEVMAQFA